PTTPGALQPSYGGSSGDAFVAKLSADGRALAYATYLGGSGYDEGYGLAVDAAGSAYVSGVTRSPTFPTTPGALQAAYGGGVYDAFVAKLNADGGALVYSTYLGGSDDDDGHGLAVDAAGSAYVSGVTRSPTFPTTPGALQATYGGGVYDAFVAKIADTTT